MKTKSIKTYVEENEKLRSKLEKRSVSLYLFASLSLLLFRSLSLYLSPHIFLSISFSLSLRTREVRDLKRALKDLTELQDSDDDESQMSDSDDDDRAAKRQRGVQDPDSDSDE